jgi:hypothetical protein
MPILTINGSLQNFMYNTYYIWNISNANISFSSSLNKLIELWEFTMYIFSIGAIKEKSSSKNLVFIFLQLRKTLIN